MPTGEKAKSPGHRNCVVSGCTNTWRILDGWRQEECEKHGCLKGSGSCVCAQPFYLYTFPDRKKNRERRQAWSQNIKGDCGTNRNWEPKNHHRVCSIHFPEGAPSEKYPDPTLNLGHESSASLTSKRSMRDTKCIGDTNSDTAHSSRPNLNLNQNFESSSVSTPRRSSRIVVKSTSDNIGNDPSNLDHEPCFRPKTSNSSRIGVQRTTSIPIAKSPGHRNCVVSGCTNTWRILDGWRQEECEEHGFLKGSGGCVCPEPFHLFPFPDRKKGERRRAWAQNVKGESDWEPKNHHRVCSIHFPDGAPSEKYPDPTLNLGHESSASLTPKISLRDIKGIGDTNSDTARSSSPNLNLNQNFESSSMSTPRNSSRIVVKSTSDNIGNDPSNLGHEPCFRPKTRNSSRTGVQHTTSETIVKSPGHRNCVVSGCTNTWRILDGWRQEECEEHGFLKGSGYCVCPQPFYLYPFPDRKNVERRQAWARNIRGKSNDKAVWEPKNHHRVCSIHFLDGAPSEIYPDPILNMGYESTSLSQPDRSSRKAVKDALSDTCDLVPNLNLTDKCTSLSTPKKSLKRVVQDTTSSDTDETKTFKLMKQSKDKSEKAVPDLVNNLASLGQKYASEFTDDQLLGMCTTVVPKGTVDLLGTDSLKDVCQQSGVSVTESSLGPLLFGNVAGLQRAEMLIKQYKEKLKESPMKSGGKNKTTVKIHNLQQEHGQLQNDKANVGTSPDSLKSNCKITIKDTTNYVPKLDEPQSRTVVFNISHQSRVVGTSAKSTSSHSLINSKPDVFLEVKKESTESKNKEASQSDNDWDMEEADDAHTLGDSENTCAEVEYSEYRQQCTNDQETETSQANCVCVICRKGYGDLLELQEHISQEHCGTDARKMYKNKPVGYQCTLCPIMLPTAKLLAVHIVNLHVKVRNKVKVSGNEGGNGTVEYSDDKIVEKKDVGSQQVGSTRPKPKSFFSAYTSLLKAKQNDSRKTYSCELCGKILLSRRSFQKHINRKKCMHMKDHYQMESDTEEFNNTQSVLVKEDKGKSEEKPKAERVKLCELCGKTFSRKRLLHHKRSVHKLHLNDSKQVNSAKLPKKENTSQALLCELCGTNFSSKKSYRRHKKRNRCMVRMDTFQIKRFNVTANINTDRPEMEHLKNFPYFCDLCHKGFMSRKSILRHKRWQICVPGHKAPPKRLYKPLNRKAIPQVIDYAAWGYDEEELDRDAKRYPVANKYIHPCDHCSYTSTYYGLDKHIVRCHSTKRLACPNCPRLFALKWTLMDHLRNCPSKEDPDSCKDIETKDAASHIVQNDADTMLETVGNTATIVEVKPEQTDAEFTEAEEQASNMEAALKAKELVYCEECKYCCSRGGMGTHMLYHTNNFYIPCVICGKRISNPHILKKHLRRHYDSKTNELIIPKSTGQEKKFKRPRCIIPDGTTYLCHECGAEFDNTSELKNHQRHHKADREGSYKVLYQTKTVPKKCDCPEQVCQKDCSKETVTVQVKRFGCPVKGCDVTLTRYTDVPRHVQTVHDDSDVGACGECGRVFKHRKNVDMHIRMVHRKECSVYCELCGKGFFNNIRLKAHLETHKDIGDRKSHTSCEICGKVMTKKHLKTHLARHSGIRPYKCELCSNSFPSRSGLTAHLTNVHSSHKPYICSHPGCDRAFKMKSKLTYHMTIHTGESNHRCEFCDKVFTQKSTLRKHQEIHCDRAEQNELLKAMKSEEEENESSMFNQVLETTPKLEAPQVFMCSVCQATFLNYNDIEHHLRDHETESLNYHPMEVTDLNYQ